MLTWALIIWSTLANYTECLAAGELEADCRAELLLLTVERSQGGDNAALAFGIWTYRRFAWELQ